MRVQLPVTKTGFLALTAALAALSGCAATDPVAPPSDPTDDIKATDIVVGTVNRGGTGPCYGLITDDGVQYALYEAKGRALPTGIRIEVATAPSRLRINCGSGQLVEVKALAPVK